MMEKTIAETISNAAKREGENRKKFVKDRIVGQINETTDEISQNIFAPGKVYAYLVSVNDFPITLNDFRSLSRTDLRMTRGQYTIQYIPSGSYKRNPKFPYLIGQDLVRIRVTVSGPMHWKRLSERIPELGWLDRNTQISTELFSIAKKHPGLVLRFGVDFIKYCDTIESRAKELGIDIDHKPLVMYQWGQNPPVQAEINLTQNNKATYADVLRTVQDESKGEEQV